MLGQLVRCVLIFPCMLDFSLSYVLWEGHSFFCFWTNTTVFQHFSEFGLAFLPLGCGNPFLYGLCKDPFIPLSKWLMIALGGAEAGTLL